MDSEITTNPKTNLTEVRQIQLKCLEILQIVDRICRKHGIDYSLCGGSVVGAYLYGGCLPWDDDIDLMMTRNNYNKFIKIAPKELPEGFSLINYNNSNNFSSLFTKIINDNTTIVQSDGQVSGIFFDITVYDRIPRNIFSKIDILLWKISQVVTIGKLKDKSIKTFFRNLALNTIFRDKRAYLRFFQGIVESLSRFKKYDYSELFGAYENTLRYAPHIFEHYTEIQFEDKKYMIVRDYIDYLTTRYNRTDFREPADRQIPSHYQYVNFTLPHSQYRPTQNK